MLDALRNKTGGWVAKIFIGVLAASFAVWGVSDVFTTRPTDTLAEVGTRQFSVLEYSNQFNRQLRVLSQRMGQPLTAEQGRQLGLDLQVLSDLLRNAALEAQADELKLQISNATVTQRIANTPQFQNSQGTFNSQQFRQLLHSSGLTEQMFVQAERQGMVRSAIAATIQQGAAAPKDFASFAHKFRNEQRDVSFFTVKVPETAVNEPSDSDLKTFYDANQHLFRVPERRVIGAIQLTPDTITNRIEISEEDIAAYFEKNKTSFSTPERRTVQQIAFANVAEATEAKSKIAAGTSFEDLAKEKGLSDTDLNLGTFSRDSMPDQSLAEAAFGLAKDVISEPVEGRLATFLLRITNVEPATQKSLADVSNDIKKTLREENARDEILTIYDRVEENRAGGQSLSDIAKDQSLEFLETALIDRTGHTEKGALVENLVDTAGIVSAAFESDIGVDNDPVTVEGDGYVWYEVRDIKASSFEPLDTAKDDAIKGWKSEQLRKLVLEKAEDLKKRTASGESLKKLAEELKVEIKTQQGVKRNEASEAFDAEAVQALFSVREDGYAVAMEGDGKGAKLMQSSPVLSVPFDRNSAEAKAIDTELATGFSNDLYVQYLADVQRRLGVEVDEDVLANAGNHQYRQHGY